MARQEATNIFSDGLMSDLHPINTPKSVLTDCLNGTYITYNGNEFILQNDMGNYKLKNCRLPVNFIPVGVKSYADILYIVSYNPLTKDVEIGSYPAPQSIFTTGDTPNTVAEEENLAPFQISGEVVYQEIINNNKKPLFVFTETDEETFKLNPGDEFQFSGELATPSFSYQHLNFYVMDEDNKIYDLDDSLLYQETKNGFELVSQDMRKVFWETPGWLAAQYDLYVPDKFNLNIRSLNVPEFLIKDGTSTATLADGLINWKPAVNHFKVSFDLSSQTIITDEFFQAELEKHISSNVYDHLFVRYIVRTSDDQQGIYGTLKGVIGNDKDYTTFQNFTENGSDYLYVDIPCIKYNYQDDILTAYTNVSVIWDFANPTNGEGEIDLTDYKGVIELTAYPILNQNGQILKFTQFASTQRHQLNNLKNTNNIQIANSIYKWSIDSDSLTVSFNVDGPFVNALNFEGNYAVTMLEKNSSGVYTFPWNVQAWPEEKWQPISNLSVYGQNTINYSPVSTIKENGLCAFSVRLKQNGQQIALQHFFLIPSEIFNEYFGIYDHYSTLSYNDWVGKYVDRISTVQLKIDQLEFDLEGKAATIKGKWNNTKEQTLVTTRPLKDSILSLLTYHYSGYHDGENWIPNESAAVSDQLRLSLNFEPNNKDVNFTFNFENKLLTGNLWNADFKLTAGLKQNYDASVINLISEGTPGNFENRCEFTTEGSTITIQANDKEVEQRERKNPVTPYLALYKSYIGKHSTSFGIVTGNGVGRSQFGIYTYYTNIGEDNEECRTECGKNGYQKLGISNTSTEYKKTYGNELAKIVRLYPQRHKGDVNVRLGYGPINSRTCTSLATQDTRENAGNGIIMKSRYNVNGANIPCYIRFGDGSIFSTIYYFLGLLARVVCYSYGEMKMYHMVELKNNQVTSASESVSVNQYNLTVELNQLNFNNDINWLNTNTIVTVDENVQYSTNLLNVTEIETKKQTPNLPLDTQHSITLDYTELSNYEELITAVANIVKDNSDDISTAIRNGQNASDGPIYWDANHKKEWLEANPGQSYPSATGWEWKEEYSRFFTKIASNGSYTASNIGCDCATDQTLRGYATGQGSTSKTGMIEIAYYDSI